MVDIWTNVERDIKALCLPFDMIWELTRRCNLACCHCYNVKDGAEPSLEEIAGIAERLRRAGTLFVTLTGGEVFSRSDIIAVLRIVGEAGFAIRIVTNGTLIEEEHIACLKNISVQEIGVSLYGVTAAVHDRITGVPGSFEATCRTVERLKEAGLPVHIQSTVLKENFGEYRQIMRLAERWKVACLIDPIVSPRDDGSRDVLGHRLDAHQARCVYEDFFDQASFPEKSEGRFLCEAGRTMGAITARGDILPCIQLPVAVGNILRQELVDVWRDAPLLRKLRAAGRGDFGACATCSRFALCHVCPGLAFLEDGHIFGPSSTACFTARTLEEYLTAKGES